MTYNPTRHSYVVIKIQNKNKDLKVQNAVFLTVFFIAILLSQYFVRYLYTIALNILFTKL